MHQVLLNLLRNAAQAMEYSGTITIQSQLGYFLHAPYQGQPAVDIKITDTGPGIEKDVLQKMFIPFFTTKEDGNGLGLAISQRLVEAHHGNLRVQSTLNKGSTFTVALPILLNT